ncbi:MAG: S-layer homology domain-containing protein [Ruminiclostridium sp.]|nr:S-layer homology domain-containing protein [Ruminiclostridium sp.]
MKKRVLSLLMAFVMAVGLLPVGAMATGTESITVYASVAQNGEFVTGKDDATIAYVPVTVTGENPTIGDTFTALHEQYYNGSDGYDTVDSTYGAQVNRFWGVTSSSVGYYYNNNYAMGLTDSVEDGAHLVFWFYQDGSSWSDQYTHFESTTATVDGGQALDLTLAAYGYRGDTPFSGAAITVDGKELPGKSTDTDGKVTLYFAESGTYLVSAKAVGGSYIVPPVCVVTVSNDDADAADALAADKNALTLPKSVTDNIELPSVGASGKTSITWATSDAAVITADGKVTRGSENKTVTLTATLKYGSTATKEITVTVPAISADELIAAAKAELEKGLTISEWNEAATEKQDTNVVTVAQSAVNKVVSGVTIANTVTTANSAIAQDGAITYPAFMNGYGAQTGDVTFTLSLGEATDTVTLSVTVPETKKSRYLAMEEAADKLAQSILKDNTALNNITSDLNFTSNQLGCTYIKFNSDQWTIPAEGQAYLDKYGTVTRPAMGSGDASFTATFTMSWDGVSESYMEQYGYPSEYTGTIPKDKNIDIKLTIKAMDESAVNALTTEMDAALETAINSIRFYTKSTAVTQNDLSNITENLKLISIPGYTKNTTWTTDNPAIQITDGSNIAVVTLPTDGEVDAGTLTVTISKNGVSRSKSFDTIVPALSDEEVQAARDELQRVADAITFDLIKGTNTEQTAVTQKLQLKQSAKIDGETVKPTGSNSEPYTYLIEWEITPADFITIAEHNGTATFTQPTDVDKEVTLKATISRKTPIAGVEGIEKTIEIVVPVSRTPNTAASLETLLDGTAAGLTSTSEWEAFLAMAAYEDTRPSGQKLTDAAKQNMINASIAKISAASPKETDWSKAILDMQSIGIDPKQLYPVNSNTPIDAVAGLNGMTHNAGVWTAAYTLLSWQQGDYNTGTQEEDLIAALANAQLENGAWTSWRDAEADATGLAIQVLAAYYDTNAVAKTAVDKAIDYLSGVQLDNGGFGGQWGENANNVACVISGLCAMGIDPDTDIRFIKNGNSALDALLAYALPDNSGFTKSLGSTTLDGIANQQAFAALIAAYNVMKSGTAYNVYDFSGNTLVPGRATGTGSVVTPSDPSGDNITVTLSIKSDTSYWLRSKAVTLPGTDATVYHALVNGLKDTGITQVGAETGYVKSMTKGGTTLEEFGSGKNAGWMYKVNGELPEVGLTDCEIENGDVIVWFYTEDWTSVPGAGGLGSVDQEETEEPTAFPFTDVSEGDYYYDAVQWAVEKGITLGTSDTTFHPEAGCTRGQMVTFLWRAAGEPAAKTSDCVFTDVDKDAYYYEALLWAVENGITTGTSETKFSPDGDCTRGQMAVFLHRSAKTPAVSGSHTFDDVKSDAYYSDAVTWAAAEGITTGTSETTFHPNGDCTRGQMVTFLMRYLETIA